MPQKMIDHEQDLIYICMYRVGFLIFAMGDQMIQLAQSNILSIEKLDNFEYNIRTIIKLQLRVDIRQKLWIINNRANILCKFELAKFGMDTDIEDPVSGDQLVWNGEFSVFLNDDDASIDAEALESNLAINTGTEFNINDREDQDYFQGQEVFEVYLYNTELLNASRVNINKVFSSGVMQTFVSSILAASHHKRVVMSPIENSKVYKELLIPSYPAYKALIYADEYYGLYKNGAAIYYDTDVLYIINPNGKPTAARELEWLETCFLITGRGSSLPGNGMVSKPNEERYYINVPEENVSPQRPSASKAMEYGGTIKMVDTSDVTVGTTATSLSSNSSNVYQTYVRGTDNTFSSNALKSRMEENDAVIYINANGLDINAFTLNKSYSVIFEDVTKQMKYGTGRYRIAYADHVLVLQSDQYMKSSHQIVLKKCSNN